MKNILTVVLFSICFAANIRAQTETLSNNQIIQMTQAGLSRELIARKIKDSSGSYETTAENLIELKKAGVADEVIALMLDAKTAVKKSAAETVQTNARTFSESPTSSRVVLDSKEALKQAKTIAVEKSTLNPSRQALEKELLKREDWRRLNLNIVRYKESADLYVEIGFVPLSIITHRYVFRVYDRKSGTVIAAGETTSWGSLAANLAREISKKINKIL